MKPEARPEFRLGEVRALAGRRIAGIAMRYGAVAPCLAERFLPGAFGDVPDRIGLNLQHDGNLVVGQAELLDDELALRVEADVAEAVHSLVARGALSGLSIEFLPRAERKDGAIRVIEKADLAGLAVVDKAAYPTATVEARARLDVPDRQVLFRALSGLV